MSQFPLCEKAGLRCRTLGASLGLFISAAEVEAYLQRCESDNLKADKELRKDNPEDDRQKLRNFTEETPQVAEMTDMPNPSKTIPKSAGRQMADKGELVFRAEDFEQELCGFPTYSLMCASIANRIFRQWLERQPVVSLDKRADGEFYFMNPKVSFRDPSEMYTARLANIQPIEADSADAIVRDMGRLEPNKDGLFNLGHEIAKLIERARALRAKGGG